MTVYPAQIDNSISLPLVNNNSTFFDETIINNLRAAIVATQTELGVKPSATYATVRARLDAMESALGAGGVFVAGGDLSGTSTVQTVIKIQGKSVSPSTPADGYVLTWSSGLNQWLPKATSEVTPSIVTIAIKTTTYAIAASDYIIGTDSTGGAFTVTLLPTPETGRVFIVKDTNATAFLNNITINTSDGTRIDGSFNYKLGTNYSSATFVYNGTQWNVI